MAEQSDHDQPIPIATRRLRFRAGIRRFTPISANLMEEQNQRETKGYQRQRGPYCAHQGLIEVYQRAFKCE